MPSLPTWSNQDLQLFHGTTLAAARDIIARGVDVAFGKPDCDFGKGFYCTTSETQAREWASIKATRTAQQPAITAFRLTRLALSELQALVFIRADKAATDYWSLVHTCRTTYANLPSLPYDIIYGPVAMPWFDLRVKPDSDQISFHSPAAQRVLNTSPNRSILNP